MKKLDYSSKFMFLGSCFSENIHNKLEKLGFNSTCNPFGVIFNPISIADFILNEDDILFKEDSFLQRDNIQLNWFANSKVYGLDKLEFKTKLQQLRTNFLSDLKSADVLFITLGTAFIYERENLIVANCHKVPQINFTKRLLTSEEISEKFDKVYSFLKELNPALNIVFTVSPVRHIKDGLIENNRSKAVLFNFLTEIESRVDVRYFSAYEIVMDELRDYRFFKDDTVHPNQKAIDYVYDNFEKEYLSTEAISISKEYAKLKQYFNHKPIHPESISQQKADEKMKLKLKDFLKKNPKVNS